jgi:hypothetical protein
MESARLSHRGPDFTARGMMPRTFADAPLIRATSVASCIQSKIPVINDDVSSGSQTDVHGTGDYVRLTSKIGSHFPGAGEPNLGAIFAPSEKMRPRRHIAPDTGTGLLRHRGCARIAP